MSIVCTLQALEANEKTNAIIDVVREAEVSIISIYTINLFQTANANMVHVCTINVLYHHTFNIQ